MNLKSAVLPLYPADILLPAAGVTPSWCVIAADQFTSSPEYWEKVESEVGELPSTLRLILPELYLQSESVAQIKSRVAGVQQAMRDYLADGFFTEHANIVVYVERKTAYVQQRKSLVLALDLESYTYLPVASDSESGLYDVRASEATVLERIPAREQVRAAAMLELPHVQVLFDDPDNTVFDAIAAAKINQAAPLYETDLMLNGGEIKAWAISGESELWQEILRLISGTENASRGFRFIVGDGNHSLAAAKSHWEKLKANGAKADHFARYALVEIINVHDAGLRMEPIHRLLRGIDLPQFAAAVAKWNAEQKTTAQYEEIQVVSKGESKKMEIAKRSELLIEAVQEIVDRLIRSKGLEAAKACEYIHGEEELKRLVIAEDSLGLVLPALDRGALFDYVAKHHAMPRKSFSLGEAEEKRYYCECKVISKAAAV